MTNAEKLLATLAVDETATELEGCVVIDDEGYPIVPSSLKKIAVQGDHNVKTVPFDCPRYSDGRDLSTMKVYINYLRSDGEAGAALCENVTADETNSTRMHFDWIISDHVTAVSGPISFLVCVKRVDEDGIPQNHWHSELNSDMTVSEGLEANVVVADRFPDIITQLLVRMDIVEGKAVVVTGEQIQALNARMNTFTSLPAGSTAGDAELADIRVGYDGTTYPTAGEAVRRQVGQLSEEKVSYEHVRGNNLFDESTIVLGSWWTKTGLESNQYTTSYRACEVDVSGIDTVTINAQRTSGEINPRLYNYFTVDGDGVVSDEVVVSTYYEKTLNLPEGTKKLRFNLTASLDNAFTVMVNKGDTALPYEPFYKRRVIPDVAELEKHVEDLESNVAELEKQVEDLETEKETPKIYPRIVLGNAIYAVAGDTIQVFYKSLFDSDIGNLHIMFECAKGKNYPRYWEFTPTASDVGSYPITIKLLDNAGNVIAEKTSNLMVVAASNPSSSVNILCVGDSTMENGQIPIEASRRMKGTAGTATSPAALSLSNINFVGRKTNADGTVGWEGTGGWTYGSYNISGYTAIRFTVSGANDLNIGAVYQVGNYKLTISEINVTNGSGNVRCLFYFATPYNSGWDNTAQNGSMTRASGEGQSAVSFSAWTKETYQPFWDAGANAWDITGYRDAYCNGHIDVICVLLGINSLIGKTPFTEVSVNEAMILCRNIHAQLPNCKIVVSTLPPVSPNGGIAANYGASSAIGAYSAGVKNLMVADYNLALIELAESEEFSSYVVLSNSHAQFDADNGYPTVQKAINTRASTKETLQSNGVHPSNEGYWQLSDALAFRAVLGALA